MLQKKHIGSLALVKNKKNFDNQKLNNLVVQKNVINYKKKETNKWWSLFF